MDRARHARGSSTACERSTAKLDLLRVREAEVLTRHARQRLREMLGDRAFQEVADGAGSGRTLAGPTDRGASGPAVCRRRVDRDAHADVVRDTAKYGIVVEPVQVLQDQPALAHQLWIFELGEVGVELGDEQRVVIGEPGDEFGIDCEVMGRWMAGAAGAPIAFEGLLEEDTAALFDE